VDRPGQRGSSVAIPRAACYDQGFPRAGKQH
jgi:hypothetical protein